MNGRSIDLNCDLGESADPTRIALDTALLDTVTSANIACGGHAGDEATMTAIVRAAKARSVSIGAHPGYPDRARFGRVDLAMTPDEIESSVTDQIASLDRIARSLGTRIRFVKPHGALYHAAMKHAAVANGIGRAAHRVDPSLILIGLAGAPALDAWRAIGFRAAAEAFADRMYEPDGSLRSRSRPGALIVDPVAAAAQALRIAQGAGAIASDGTIVPIAADTICIHSDTPGSPAIARSVRAALEQGGLAVRPFAT